VRPDPHYAFRMSARQLDIILDALWEYQYHEGTVLGKSTTKVQDLRRSLLVASVAQDAGEDWGLELPALPPEST